MTSCTKCHGSGEVYVIGNFTLPCECTKPKLKPVPQQTVVDVRPQPTRKLFPPGFEVEFKADYGGWKKGDVRTILQSGDCDPYPTSYVVLQMDGDRKGRAKIIENPVDYLELLNPEA